MWGHGDIRRPNDVCTRGGIMTEFDSVVREMCFPFSIYRFPQMFGEWIPHEHVECIYAPFRRWAACEIRGQSLAIVREVDTIKTLLEKMLNGGTIAFQPREAENRKDRDL
jgi:hypothetical protein